MKLELEEQIVSLPAVLVEQCRASGQIAQRRSEGSGLLGAFAGQEIERRNLFAFIA